MTKISLALLTALGIGAAAKVALLAHDAARAPDRISGATSGPPPVEPAAGPNPRAPAAHLAAEGAETDDQSSADPASAAPRRRLMLDRLTQSEIEVLEQLAERRAALDERERQLEQHAALLETAEAMLAAQLERLEQLRSEIAATVAAHDAEEQARLTGLIKIYETMKPKAAAEIFNRLEMPILIRVVERMRAPKSADVLARMDPAKAKQVTAELARRTELLRAGGGS